MMKSDVVLRLNHPSRMYTAGDRVIGEVNVILTQEVKVKVMVVKFYGFGCVSWKEMRTYSKGFATSDELTKNEVYLDHNIVLLKKDAPPPKKTNRRKSARPSIVLSLLRTVTPESDDGIVISPGNHTYPFEFTLPKNLPSTFEGRWGRVKYGVKVALERPWKFDICREVEINVNAHLDLNEEIELARPIGAMTEFNAGSFFSCRRGPVTVELRIGRRGYVSGESIPFYAEVENNSRRPIYDIKVGLQQHVTYRAEDKLKKASSYITVLSKGEVAAGATQVWDSDSLVVPPKLPPTTATHIKALQIKYTVTLSVVHSTWAEPHMLPCNVVIGNVALRKSTIATYLKLLGYNMTSGGSPTAIPKHRHSGPIERQDSRGEGAACKSATLSVPANHMAPRQSAPNLLLVPSTNDLARRRSMSDATHKQQSGLYRIPSRGSNLDLAQVKIVV